MVRNLIFFVNDAINGGNLILVELGKRLQQLGQYVDCLTLMPRESDLLDKEFELLNGTFEQARAAKTYDFVFLASASLICHAMPYANEAKIVLICQGYESFLYGTSYEDCLQEVQSIAETMSLPVHIIATSRSIQEIINRRLGRSSYYLPLAIDHRGFEQQNRADGARKRILMVGSYLAPFKGMVDGFKALELVSREHRIELLLLTQETRYREILNGWSFPISLNNSYRHDQVHHIFSSCDLYLCTSWYEGFGLPALEAFSCGRPVVSTKNFGVLDYGIDEENILLAQPHNPADIAEKVNRLLSDSRLCDELVQNALSTSTHFNWDRTMAEFLVIQSAISQSAAVAPLSTKEAKALLDKLENDGVVIPPQIYLKLKEVHKPILEVCRQFTAKQIDKTAAVATLQIIAADMKPLTINRRTQYYFEFKRFLDLCQLLLSLADSDHFAELAMRIGKNIELRDDKRRDLVMSDD